MILPIELQSKSFKSSGLGYEKKDVEMFIEEVYKSYELVYKENKELNEKMQTLTSALTQYKTVEKTLQKALILAQKTADNVKEAAKEKAQMIEDEAKYKAKLIIAETEQQLESMQTKLANLSNQYDIYRAQIKQMALTQIDIIESESFKLQTLDSIMANEFNLSEKAEHAFANMVDEAAVTMEQTGDGGSRTSQVKRKNTEPPAKAGDDDDISFSIVYEDNE